MPPPGDADAPPPDHESAFDPGPEPVVDAAPAQTPGRAPRRAHTAPAPGAGSNGGIQRYGEAVVRDLLGATFLEEVETPPPARFGERG